MTKPRDPLTPKVEDRGASTVAGLIVLGKERWWWLQRLRPWRAYSRFADIGGSVLTSGMSYQALFAVFAGLYVGFGVAGIWLRSRPEVLKQLVEQINLFVPGLLGHDGVVSINTLLEARVLDWTSVAAGFALLWVAVKWFTGTRRAIRITFDLEVKQYRNAVLLKLRDFVLALGFFLAMIISAALTVLSSGLASNIIEWLHWDPDAWIVSGLGTATRYAAMYVFDVLVLIAIHYYLAEIRIGWWRLLRGCALGGFAMFLIKLSGTLLLGSASSNPLLASFAVLIGLLVWFNLICRVLLLTASWIAVGQNPYLGLPTEDGTPADVLL